VAISFDKILRLTRTQSQPPQQPWSRKLTESRRSMGSGECRPLPLWHARQAASPTRRTPATHSTTARRSQNPQATDRAVSAPAREGTQNPASWNRPWHACR